MRPKHARRRDENEPEIVKAFAARGCSVTRLDGVGVPDLLVGLNQTTWLVEVKKPRGPKGGLTSTRYEHLGGRGDFTSDQVKWWDAWRGETPVVVRTVDDVELLVALAKTPTNQRLTPDDVRQIAEHEVRQALAEGATESAAARRTQKRSPRR